MNSRRKKDRKQEEATKEVKIKSPLRWTVIIVLVPTAISAAILFKYTKDFWFSPEQTTSDEPVPLKEENPIVVTALGRLVPEGEIIQLSASPSLEGTRIASLLVQEGDKVEQGQVIAILDNRDRRIAAQQSAREAVKVAQARLNQILAGASQREIEAQTAVITRLELELKEAEGVLTATITRVKAELNNAQLEYQRYQHLYGEGAISASARDSHQLMVETTAAELEEAVANRDRTLGSLQEQLKQARATLNQIREVRPVDVAAGQAEVDRAQAAVSQAEADLKLAYVRSPQTGTILKINARPGEIIGDGGIVELGETERMEVIAEVYQTDIGEINLGQKAMVTSEVFSEELKGEVIRIGSQISRQNIFAVESGADVDRRIVEVRIGLNPEDSQQVQNLTNLQVEVAFLNNNNK